MNGWFSSVFHHPQPPSSCWKSPSRRRPAADLAIEHRQPLGRRELQLRQRARHQHVRQEARERLLGAAVRIRREEVERAEQRAGHRRRERDARRCAPRDSTVAGIVTSVVCSPAPTSDPLRPTSRRRPYGSTGIGSSTASLSASVRAVAVTIAVPARRRAEPPVVAPLAAAGDGAAGRRAAASCRPARLEPLRRERDASCPSRPADSCARSSAARPGRLR